LERVFPLGGAGSRRKRSPADLERVMHRTVKTVSVSSFGERLDVRPANRAGIDSRKSNRCFSRSAERAQKGPEQCPGLIVFAMIDN
jgi:hypothetical protein